MSGRNIHLQRDVSILHAAYISEQALSHYLCSDLLDQGLFSLSASTPRWTDISTTHGQFGGNGSDSLVDPLATLVGDKRGHSLDVLLLGNLLQSLPVSMLANG